MKLEVLPSAAHTKYTAAPTHTRGAQTKEKKQFLLYAVCTRHTSLMPVLKSDFRISYRAAHLWAAIIATRFPVKQIHAQALVKADLTCTKITDGCEASTTGWCHDFLYKLCLLCTQTHVLWVHTDSGPAAEDGRAIIEGSAVLIRLLSGLQRRPSGAERDPQSAGSCYNRRNSAGRFRWREQREVTCVWGGDNITESYLCVCVCVQVYICAVPLRTQRISHLPLQKHIPFHPLPRLAPERHIHTNTCTFTWQRSVIAQPAPWLTAPHPLNRKTTACLHTGRRQLQMNIQSVSVSFTFLSARGYLIM